MVGIAVSQATNYTLSLQQGAATVLRLTYTDKATETPIDLTGYEARLQIRRSYQDSTADLELLSTDGEITIDGPNGEIEATFPKDKVNALETNNTEIEDWVWGLQIYNPNDEETTARMLLSGCVYIYPSPVRDEP
jgi:hypothetical protein